MCGICGIVCARESESLGADVAAMCRAAAHRGPDDGGLALFPAHGQPPVEARRGETPAAIPARAALGHVRLAIIDLTAAGHQPMSDPSGRHWIVFNGEVYNHVELRAELEQAGVSFRTRSDTEVLLQAYLRWGADCLPRFNGMWSLAIYDAGTGELFCARDRFGIKPFYHVLENGRFAFASEIKQLLELPWVGREANRARLADFFLWGLETHTDETFFSRIRCLPAAHCVRLTAADLASGRWAPRRYWTPSAAEPLEDRAAFAAFRELLADAVRLRLRSDVPVGVTLSGGLDSSSVVCLAGEQRRRTAEAAPLDAFNVEYEGRRYSERRFAEAAADKAGARMVVLRPGEADLARDWARFVWHMEEPFGTLSFLSSFQIYRMIRERGISVVLSGQGGDELLLGYERYRTYDALFQLRAGRPGAAWAEILAARRHANLPLRIQLAAGAYYSVPLLRAIRRRRLVRPILGRDFYGAHAGQTEHLRASMLHADRRDLQCGEMFHYQLPHLLRHEDRVSMAHSVESRLPFLDFRLLEWVLGQPTRLLFREGWSKYVLRQALDGLLPDVVRDRTDKMGYETPTGSLLRRNGGLFRDLLERQRDDAVLDVPALLRNFAAPAMDERLLCAACSYLSWKETFRAT